MEHFEITHHRLRKPHYFDGKLSKGFKYLLVNKIITNIAAGFFAVFLPIFLYEILDKNLTFLSLYYLATYTLSLLFIFFLARDLNRFGFKKALQISTLVGAIYYLSIFLLKEDNYLFIMPIMIFSIALWRFLYWVPYNIDFAKFTSKEDRGKGVGFVEATLSLVGIVTPIIAGWVVLKLGFNVLFLIGVVIFLVSYFPLIKLPKTREKFTWKNSQFFRKICEKKNRKLAWFFFLDGAEGVLAVFVWPIFIYELLEGNYLEIGAISSLVVLFTIFLQLLAGKITDKKRNKFIETGGFLYALGWFLKIFAITAFHVFIFDAFHRFMKVFYRIPLDTLVFETAFNQKHLIDEFNLFRQFYLGLGRIAMTILVLILSIFITSINWIFGLGVVTVLLISVFYKKIQNSLI